MLADADQPMDQRGSISTAGIRAHSSCERLTGVAAAGGVQAAMQVQVLPGQLPGCQGLQAAAERAVA